jgi:hypothetical protein
MSDKFERQIAIWGLVIAVISIFLSLQANSIARKSIKAQLIVHYTDFLRQSSTGFGDPMEGEAFCDYSYLITNLGGVETAIIGQHVTIAFAGDSDFVSSTNAYMSEKFDSPNIEWVTSYIMTQPYTGTLIVGAAEGRLYEFLPAESIAKFPISFDGNSTRELPVRVWFKFKQTHRWGTRVDSREGYYPVYVSHTFDLANGEKLITPTFTCFYLYPLDK